MTINGALTELYIQLPDCDLKTVAGKTISIKAGVYRVTPSNPHNLRDCDLHRSAADGGNVTVDLYIDANGVVRVS